MTYNEATEDQFGRQVTPALFNTSKDGSGTWYYALVDSSGRLVLGTSTASLGTVGLNAGTNRVGITLDDPHEIRVVKSIDASIGAYAAGDTVSDTDCCTTATAWEFTGMASANGGYGEIVSSTIFSKTRNIEPRLTALLFNATPTRGMTDNSPCTVPAAGDVAKYLDEIAYPALKKVSTAVASARTVTPSTVGNLPLRYKCAAGSTSIFVVLKTLDIFTQVPTTDIGIKFEVIHL